jgi:hypothetical protein
MKLLIMTMQILMIDSKEKKMIFQIYLALILVKFIQV